MLVEEDKRAGNYGTRILYLVGCSYARIKVDNTSF